MIKLKQTIWLYILLFFGGAGAQAEELDSLKALLKNVSDVEKIDVLNKLSTQYLNTNNERSLYYARQALMLAESLDLPKKLGESLVSVGVILRNTGNSDLALQHFTRALQVAEAENLLALEADVLHKIGVTYLFVNDFEQALAFANKELPLWKILMDKRGIADALNFMGLIYINTKQYEKAHQALQESLNIGEELGDDNMVYKPLVNLGDLYLAYAKPAEALEYVQKSYQISAKRNNKFGMAVASLKMGTAQYQLGNTEQAIDLIKRGLKMAEDINSLSLIRNSYKELAYIFESKENFRSALLYNKLYIATEDSMLNDMTRRKIAEIKMKYDFEKQEAAIQELEEKNKNFRFRMVSIASMFILAVVLLVVTANRYQIKKQYSAQLEENLERSQKDPVKQQQNKKAISYAMKAQESFHMEGAPAFMNIFTNYFVVKKPKQEVGGDLYWVTLKGDQITIVVADCPGHGLAGSFNAIILNSILMQITSENHHQTPADILKKLNKRLIQFLDPQENAGIQQGSMAAVLSFNINTKRLIYAGAKIPLYYIRNNNLLIVPPDKNDIGGSIYAEARNYNNKIISLQKNDRLLVFTDGYRKQFGGDTKETRFTERNLRQLLSDTATSPLDVQKDILLRSFQQWKKDRPQTDDLLVLGIEV